MYYVFWAKVHICRVRSDLLERHGVLIAGTILPAKSDSDAIFCLQSYQGLRIDISLVY